MSEQQPKKPNNDKLSLVGVIMLIIAVLVFSGIFTDAEGPIKVMDFSNLQGAFGTISEGSNFRGSGGTSAKEGFLFALTLAPTVMVAMGLIQIFENYGALKAAGIGPGDKVIVPACTFLATAGAVICAGAVPVFAEIDESLSLDPDHLEEVIDKDTKAVIPVPILGNPCQIDRILEIAGRHHLTVIEDAAQSCGASYHGKRVGTSGQINTFSLQMNKIMTTGEGGVVVTDDPKLYERAVRYHDQGMFRESEGFLNSSAEADVFVGQNYRMSEFSGAVALEQVRKLDEMLEKMRWAKRAVKEQLKGTPGFCFRRINDEEGDAGNALILLLDDPARVQPFLDAICAEGVPFSRLYNGEPVYMNPQILYQRTPDGSGFPFSMVDPPVAYTPDMCPISVGILSRNVELMIGTTWTQQDIEDVVHAVRKVASAVL